MKEDIPYLGLLIENTKRMLPPSGIVFLPEGAECLNDCKMTIIKLAENKIKELEDEFYNL